MHAWAILTPEYPPAPGGVADYTALVAEGLRDAGDRVTVLAPTPARAEADIDLRELPPGFTASCLRRLSGEISKLPAGTVLLVQYVPQGFGWRGVNLRFAHWLRAQRLPVWVVFHEVIFPFVHSPLRRNLVALGTRAMLALIARRAERQFVTIPAWRRYLETWTTVTAEWLPVPSNIPTVASAAAVERMRQNLALPPNVPVVGHFGTYGSLVTDVLEPALHALLASNPNNVLLLVGRNSREFRARLLLDAPASSSRVFATGELSGPETSAALCLSDVLLLPFPDGASTRRGSLMAGLALGRAIVSTSGHLSEDIWAQSAALALAPAGDPRALCAATEALLQDPSKRLELQRRATALYREHFDVGHVIHKLRQARSTARSC